MSPFATHAGSQSGQAATREVTRRKSLASTPCDTNRGAQFATAASTRSSATRDYLLDRAAEVAQHHRGGVASRAGGHRRARMRRRAGLVQTVDRQPVLRPAWNGTQRTRLRQAHLTAVTGTTPVVLVQPLE